MLTGQPSLTRKKRNWCSASFLLHRRVPVEWPCSRDSKVACDVPLSALVPGKSSPPEATDRCVLSMHISSRRASINASVQRIHEDLRKLRWTAPHSRLFYSKFQNRIYGSCHAARRPPN